MISLLLALAPVSAFEDPPIAPPTDAPTAAQRERGLVLRTDEATPGYTLTAPLRSTTTYLVDASGEVVHTWPCEFPPGNTVVLLADGSILRACRVENSSFRAGGIGGRLQRISWDGKVTWDYLLSDAQRVQHHDARVLPNGNVLTLVWDDMAPSDAAAAGRDAAEIPLAGIRPDSVLELSPLGPDRAQIVWEWRARDHLIQDRDETKANYGDIAARPERIDVNGDHRREAPLTAAQRERRAETERRMRATGYAGGGDDPTAKSGDPSKPDDPARGPGRDGDWLHTNGLSWFAGLDLIALSVRRVDEIWIIDHSTTTEEARGSTGGRWKHGGDLLARWGNPKMHGGGTAADRRLFRQHDVTWISAEEGGLGLLVFNNGEGRPAGEYSTVDEILLPFDTARGFGPIAAIAAVTPRWSYAAPDKTSFYSSFISGAERLPSGNTLICSGVDGRVFEVTRAGEIVFEYLNPHGGEVQMGPPPGRDPAGGPAGGPRGDPPPDGARAGRPDGPPDGPPDARDARGLRGNTGRPGGLDEKALFRATHIPLDHPGLAGRLPQ
jgi:hypothetical protein